MENMMTKLEGILNSLRDLSGAGHFQGGFNNIASAVAFISEHEDQLRDEGIRDEEFEKATAQLRGLADQRAEIRKAISVLLGGLFKFWKGTAEKKRT